MALLRQIINGQRVNTINVDASADDLDALKSLLEGKIEEWEKKAEGGTATTAPEKLNLMRFACGKNGKPRYSCAFTLRHVDPAKDDADIKSLVIGAFDADWVTSEKAEYCRLIDNNSKDMA